MIIRWLIFIFSFLVISNAFALENLDEMEARDGRRTDNTFYKGLDTASEYYWQPQTLVYYDVTTGHEVWKITNCPEGEEGTFGEEYGEPSMWSADGKRVAFSIDTSLSSAYVRDHTGRQAGAYFTSLADYSKLRIAHDHIMRTRSHRFNFGWSPSEPDVAYNVGSDRDSEGNSDRYVYKATVSDGSIATEQWVDLGATGDRQIRKGISGDGMKAFAMAWGWSDPVYAITLLPSGSKALDESWNVDSANRNWDDDWGRTPSSSWGVHNARMTGSASGGYWLYINLDPGAWWRVKLTGSATDGGPEHTTDTSSTYIWWTGNAAQTEIQPAVVSGKDDDNDEGDCDYEGNTGYYGPWCCDNDGGTTECDSYHSHPYHHADGQIVVYNRWDVGALVYDVDNTEYSPNETGFSLGAGNWQHTSWQAFSDFSVEWPGVGNNILHTIDHIGDAAYAISYTHEEGSGDDYGANQSPDGTKVAWGSSFLMAGSGFEYNDIFVTTAYYPYPPEITACTATGGVVTVTWDFATDGTTRGYTTRGWPQPGVSDPPPPRETEKFRLWRCTGTCTATSGTWTPLNTADADIFTMYDFSDGTWAAGDSWTITDTVSDGTYYYAITSVEWSGLESRCLSNVSKIVVSDGDGNGSTDEEAYPASPGDLDNISASDFYASFNTSNGNLIRYYNIYAADGATPSIQQQDLIASISHNHCSGGSCSWVDWLGKDDDSTLYYVTAVDTQGRESASNYVTSQSRSTDTPNAGQYTISWDDMYGSDQFAPTLSTATIAAAGTSITFAFNESVNVGTGGNGGWTITPSGGAATLSYASGDGTSSLVYTISRTIYTGETGTVSYTQPGDGIEDDEGNDLANITDDAVVNDSTQSEPAAGAVTWTCVGGAGGPSVVYDATGPAVTAP